MATEATIIDIASLFVIEKRDAPLTSSTPLKLPKLAGSGDKATLIIPNSVGYALEGKAKRHKSQATLRPRYVMLLVQILMATSPPAIEHNPRRQNGQCP